MSLTIAEIAQKLGTQKHSACAAISVLGNPAKAEDPFRISLDRKTGKYSVAPGLICKDEKSFKAPPKGKKKVVAKRAVSKGKATGANGPRLAVA